MLMLPKADAISQLNLSHQTFPSEVRSSAKELVRTSDLIVYGSFDSSSKTYDTHKKVDHGHLVNYIQKMSVMNSIKGTAPTKINIISTSVEPLPKPDSPLNNIYPGPLAEGKYICFLKKVQNSDLYKINGGWQGTYPVINDHVLTLEPSGFQEFNGDTIKTFKKKIVELQ